MSCPTCPVKAFAGAGAVLPEEHLVASSWQAARCLAGGACAARGARLVLSAAAASPAAAAAAAVGVPLTTTRSSESLKFGFGTPRNPSLAEVALPHKPLELGRRDPLLIRIRHPELPQLPVRVEQLPGVEQVGEEGSFAARMPVSIAPCAICMSVKDVASPVFACKS